MFVVWSFSFQAGIFTEDILRERIVTILLNKLVVSTDIAIDCQRFRRLRWYYKLAECARSLLTTVYLVGLCFGKDADDFVCALVVVPCADLEHAVVQCCVTPNPEIAQHLLSK